MTPYKWQVKFEKRFVNGLLEGVISPEVLGFADIEGVKKFCKNHGKVLENYRLVVKGITSTDGSCQFHVKLQYLQGTLKPVIL